MKLFFKKLNNLKSHNKDYKKKYLQVKQQIGTRTQEESRNEEKFYEKIMQCFLLLQFQEWQDSTWNKFYRKLVEHI